LRKRVKSGMGLADLHSHCAVSSATVTQVVASARGELQDLKGDQRGR